jgi:hypothetical protein
MNTGMAPPHCAASISEASLGCTPIDQLRRPSQAMAPPAGWQPSKSQLLQAPGWQSW